MSSTASAAQGEVGTQACRAYDQGDAPWVPDPVALRPTPACWFMGNPQHNSLSLLKNVLLSETQPSLGQAILGVTDTSHQHKCRTEKLPQNRLTWVEPSLEITGKVHL